MAGARFAKRCFSFLAGLVLSLAIGSSPAFAGAGTTSHAPASPSRPMAAQSQPPGWVTTWSASPVDMGNYHYTGTVRDIVFTSVAGNTVRVRLTNTFGSQPYEFGDASIGVSDSQGNITGPVVPLTFSGQRDVTIPQGAEVVSDPVSLTVPALHDLAVSVYVPHADGEQSGHPAAQQVNYLTQGTDNVMDPTTASFGQLGQWYYVDSVDVTTQPPDQGTVVALGDSITDGINSTVNANKRWPNDLARRLNAQPGETLSVADEGISGNQVLQDEGGAGVSALHRFDRDVLQRAGVNDVILLEGINDIGSADAQANQLIAGYQQLISRAHAAGVKIFGGTLTPFKGAGYWSAEKEHTREVVNNWIRTSGAFDGVIDFAKATADPSDPQTFYPPDDSGDHLHPGDTGYQAMANAVDLGMLLHPQPQPAVIGYLPSQQVTVAPGSSATMQVGASNTTSQPQIVHAHVSTPAGLTATPASVDFTVPAKSTNTASVSVSAAASAPQTFYPVPVSVTDDADGGSGPASAHSFQQTVLVAQPGSLLTAFSNAGTSNDTNVPAADFDKKGNSYSAQALAAAGLTAGKPVNVNGVSFTWPLPSPGYPDNAIADGQQVILNAPAGTQALGFLGSATGNPGQGIASLHYSDGSTTQYWLGLSNWTLEGGSSEPSYGNQVVATMPYHNCDTCSSGQDAVKSYVFGTALPVSPVKRLTSVTLPPSSAQGAMHVFALGTSTQAITPPVAQSVNPAAASPGQQVTVTGAGFGSAQGNGYVNLSDNGANWGAPGNPAVHVDSWSDTAVTFTIPTPSGTNGEVHVYPGTNASVTVVNSSGGTSDSAVLQIAPTDKPADYYDNVGTSPDSNQACADFDGLGYSYSATALANAGLKPGAPVTADGLTFTWPNVASCAPDNILAAGETMLVDGKPGDTALGVLGSSSNGGTHGTIVINYSDGTSSTQAVSFNDWAAGPSNGDTAAATMPYRNFKTGSSQTLNMYVYATTVPVDPSKTVSSVVLPNVSNEVAGVPGMHIFALALGA